MYSKIPSHHLFYDKFDVAVIDLTVDELEDVVEDKVLATGAVTAELESLGVVHGALLLIDL